MALSAAQKAFINHLVVKHHDERRGQKYTMSDAEFCREVLKCHPNTARYWRKNPEFQAALERAIREYEESRDYFKTVMRHKALEELWVQYNNAKGAEKRHYLAMILKETEEVETYKETTDYTAMTDAQLAEIYLNRRIEPPDGISVEYLKKLVESDGVKDAKNESENSDE